jgi:hypothetical protein
MRITVLHMKDCPHVALARERVGKAARRLGLTASIGERLLAERDHADEEASTFGGSPTILLNGHDPFPTPGSGLGSACRLYPTPDGLQGAPTVDQLVEVLRR